MYIHMDFVNLYVSEGEQKQSMGHIKKEHNHKRCGAHIGYMYMNVCKHLHMHIFNKRQWTNIDVAML